jgi:2,4-dienoyl-CoA reductase-like NADH-dependent reductase (Old Yellow Enzyme family)
LKAAVGRALPLLWKGAEGHVEQRTCFACHNQAFPMAAFAAARSRGFAVGDELIAYHRARAEGGVGLIVVQVAGVHETARYTGHSLMATTDDCIPGYRRLSEMLHGYGCKVFGQVFHPGREIMEGTDGSITAAYAPSAVPNERFHVMPVPLSTRLIGEVVAGYGDAALRMKRAGLDGCEIVASHGYLPLQFLNPRVNLRDDAYGGSMENRLRFLREVVADIRGKVGADFVVGLRITGDEKDADSIEASEVLQFCKMLDGDAARPDYYNVIAGTSASLAGAVHIVPPMIVDNAYVAPFAKAMKAVVSKPVFVAGRINQPQTAEQVIASGQADMCGMTRAMIADPDMPRKAEGGRTDDIRACIACNQACIGHFHLGYSISCIQHPETGREVAYGTRRPAAAPKAIMVVGGGPGGMKAAAVLAERGHRVTLYEAKGQLGGQALLAQLLPGRAEFAGDRAGRRDRGEESGGRCRLREAAEARCRRRRHRRPAAAAVLRRPGRDARRRCLAGAAGRGQCRPVRGRRRLALRLDRPRHRREAGARRLPRAPLRRRPRLRPAPALVRARQLERHPAQARRRGHTVCAALRRRR